MQLDAGCTMLHVAGADIHRRPKMTVLRALVRLRFGDGWALLATRRPERRAGAVYVAGYGVECALKARICADRGEERLDPQFFHHDLRRLAEATAKWTDIRCNRERSEALVYLQAEWDVEMRYEQRSLDSRGVNRFIKKAEEFAKWLLSD